MTPEQTAAFTRMVNAGVHDLGLTKEEAAHFLISAATTASVLAFGELTAARMLYMLALELGRRAGLDEMDEITRH